MTPKELNLLIEACFEERKAQEKNQIVSAWLNAAWQRCKRMPELSKVFREDKREMTSEEMLETVKQLNKAFGGNTY